MKVINSNHYHNLQSAKRRLLTWMLVFFFAISVPVYFLLHKVYSQLENETWYQQRSQAELLVQRIERQLQAKLLTEQQRPIAEYSFFNVLDNSLLQSTTVNLSPLSELPPKSDIPGLVGYFQIAPDGSLHIPALPELNAQQQSGLSSEALIPRIALKEKLQKLLSLNVSITEQNAARNHKESDSYKKDHDAAQSSPILAQRFDDYFKTEEGDQESANRRIKAKAPTEKKRISLAETGGMQTLSDQKLQQLNIQTTRWKQKNQADDSTSKKQQQYLDDYRQQTRKETVKIPDQSSASAIFNRSRWRRESQIATEVVMPEKDKQFAAAPANSENAKPEVKNPEKIVIGQKNLVNILSFESEVSPLQMMTLGAQYLCFYRNAWHGKSRFIQGFIVDQNFLLKLIKPIFETTRNLPLSSLLIVNQGNLLQRFTQADTGSEFLLFRRTLPPPFQKMEIIVNSTSLSTGSGKPVLDLVSTVLALVISIGFILFYRLAAGQIELAKQQRNFISSVSHELKTPLTSIRMYAEMLRSDWVADEQRKRHYYDFIFFESERLSRLISNVLQLARVDNHHAQTQLVQVNAKQLLLQVQAKVTAQIEAANFEVTLVVPENGSADAEVNVEQDAFFQVMINLVDNAIKFSKQSEHQAIDIGYRIVSQGKQIIFYVRDYGPGIEKQRMKKIFQLFYRAGDELTRTQPGTGIGLALVVQLAESMGATVDLMNRSPGAEFQVKFNCLENCEKFP
jgi:signal transduction histidine kinase